MRSVWFASALLLASTQLTGQTPRPFTIQQVLSAPYALDLIAAPVGNQFAWIENAEGRRNIWIGSATEPARQLTHYTQDDAQDIDSLTWSPDATSIAYTYGAEDGADGHPANPAHLQRPTPLEIILQPLTPNAPATVIGEGTSSLFTRDGHSLLFLRNGDIWIADLSASPSCEPSQNCHPERAQRVEGPATQPTPAQLPAPSIHQLVFDRGRASSLTLSPDGHLLAFISHRRGTDAPGHAFLALFNLTTHELTFPAPSIGDDSAPIFSPDGHQLAWLRTPFTRQPEYTPHLTSPNPWSIQLLDLATNTTHQVYQPEPNQPGSVLPHIADGEPKLFWTYFDSIGLMVHGPEQQKTNTRQAQISRVSFARPSSAQTSTDTDAPPAAHRPWLLFLSEADGFVHLYGIDPSKTDAKPAPYMSGPFETEDAVLSPDAHTLFFSSNAAKSDTQDVDREHIWAEIASPYFGGVGPVQITNGESIDTHPTVSADGKWIAVLTSSATQPMHVEFMERQTIWAPSGDLRPKVAQIIPAHPDTQSTTYPTAQLLTPTQVLFPSTDNLTLHAQLFLNPTLNPKHKHPAILFVHGGPNRQMLLGYPGMDYYSNAYAMNQYLASQGFIVLSVNYRGGTGYGLNFREAANYGPDGASEYSDVLAAQKYLASRPDVDPARIGIWGGSYGGYLTALALARNSNLFAAGVDFHGVHEWYLEGDPERWMTDPDHATASQKDAAKALAHAASPMADIEHWRSPVLLIHGDNDPEVNYAQTPTLADALRTRHVPVEELIFPDEVHGFLLHKDWVAAYEATAAFFERVLKP
jgi:dipeptidyl aminopeptidase/acylaminoacyl peptidase